MASMEVKFAGLSLKNPIIMASAPPTETVENIVRCAEAGAAAAVTKTMANFNENDSTKGARRVRKDKSGLWALSTFRRETLTVDSGIKLVADSVRLAGIPIIASVGALDMDPESWLPTCIAAQDAGASMIQLDLFYIPHPRCSPESVEQLKALLGFLGKRVKIPLAPKLNIELPAYYAAQILSGAPIAAAFAIDSIRVPPPVELSPGARSLFDNAANAGECSLFGAWQKPITLQYTRILAEQLDLPISAGGGLMTGQDAVEAMMLGATTVQFATAVIQHGFKQITTILKQIEKCLDSCGYDDVTQIRGLALRQFVREEREIEFGDFKAAVDHNQCIMCGKCTSLVFCPDIHVVDSKIKVFDDCDGCGLCVAVCPTSPKALSVLPAEEWRARNQL